MMNQTKLKPFYEFLNYATSQTEVSLVITQDDKELKMFSKSLEEDGFTESENVFGLLKNITTPSKNLVVLDEGFQKDLNDFMIQYPTGQVQIFDRESMESEVSFPVYSGVTVVFLVTKENLKNIQAQGFNILAHAGLTYQS